MTKYYRVIKDNPLWETEYLSEDIVEESPDFFERVYRSETEKMVFRTGAEMKKLFKSFVSDKETKKAAK
jgi:hypothetical protein